MLIFFSDGNGRGIGMAVLADSFMFSPLDRHAIITGSRSSNDGRQKPAQRGDTGARKGRGKKWRCLSEIRTFPATVPIAARRRQNFLWVQSWARLKGAAA